MATPVLKDWKNKSEGLTTPLSAEAIEDLETRLSNYTTQAVAEIANQIALLQPDGNVVYTTTDPPPSSLGKNGDSAVVTSTTPPKLYGPKASGAWPSGFTSLGGGAGAVASVAGKTGVVTLARGDVGLGNVDNTADSAKPVSTLQQQAINTAISNLVNGAPLALDTLQELAAQLALDESAASALATAVAGKAPALLWTDVKAANYTAAANEGVRWDVSAGSLTLTLPTAPSDKTRVAAKVVTVAGTNTLTIQRGGSSDVFNKAGGPTSFALSLLNQGVLMEYVAASGVWMVVSTDIPLSQLDARFPATARVDALEIKTGSGSANNPVTDAAAARPSGITVVYWRTSSQPANMAVGDVWEIA